MKCLSDAGLEWLSGLSCHFLRKSRELLCLFGQRFELLTNVRGRKLDNL
jgi:hypothetical protein